jgi:hypothetical protein
MFKDKSLYYRVFDRLEYNSYIFRTYENEDLNPIKDFIKHIGGEIKNDINYNYELILFTKLVTFRGNTYKPNELYICTYQGLINDNFLDGKIITPPIFNNFLEFLNFLDKNMKPDYKPKEKPKRIFESLDISKFKQNFKYKYFVVELKNEEEFNQINNILKQYEFKILTKDGDFFNKIENYLPMGLFISRDHLKTLFLYPMDEKNIKEYILDDPTNICQKIFTIKDLSSINSILRNGFESPSYKPKEKSKRLLESNDFKYEYDHICIYLVGEEQIVNAQKELFKFGFKWPSQQNETIIKPLYCDFEKLILNIWLRDHHITKMNELRYKNEKIDDADPKLYNYRDMNQIISILRFGKFKPNYEPKEKPKRLLESNEFNYKFDNIFFYLKGKNEITKGQKFVFKYGFKWASQIQNAIKNIIPLYEDSNEIILCLDLENKSISKCDTIENFNTYIVNINYYQDRADLKLYTYKNDLKIVKSIFKYGQLPPSYEPKPKIIRESNDVKYKYDEISIYLKGEEILNAQLQIINFGFKWSSQWDEKVKGKPKYIDNNEMVLSIDLKDEKLTKCNTKREFNDYIDGPNYNMNSDPKLYNYNELKDVVSILKYGHLPPSYKPKGKIRKKLLNIHMN